MRDRSSGPAKAMNPRSVSEGRGMRRPQPVKRQRGTRSWRRTGWLEVSITPVPAAAQ